MPEPASDTRTSHAGQRQVDEEDGQLDEEEAGQLDDDDEAGQLDDDDEEEAGQLDIAHRQARGGDRHSQLHPRSHLCRQQRRRVEVGGVDGEVGASDSARETSASAHRWPQR